MLTLVGIITLLVFVFVRPHEMIEALSAIPVLNLLFAFTLGAFALDNRVRFRWTGQVGAALLLLTWSSLSVVVTSDGGLIKSLIAMIAPVLLFVLITSGAATLSRLAIAATAVVLCSALLAAVGFHQSRAPRGCVEYTSERGTDRSVQTFDGRYCESRVACYQDIERYDIEYMCEHLGLFGTTSFRGRIRYRGTLNDPNEFALAIVCALPLLFALVSIRRRLLWKLATPVIVGLTLSSLLATQSRGGLLALMAMLAVVLVYRYRSWGLLATGLAGAAGLAIGGRGGSDAASSVYERYEAWAVGLELLRGKPLFGVGNGNFTEHHYLTAHNSYILIAAENGLLGLILYMSVLYASIKIPLTALRTLPASPEAAAARTWSLAMVASLVAMMTGMMFLSLSYHQVIWAYLGLSGALYGAIRHAEPDFRVRFAPGDVLIVVALVVGLLVMFFGFTKFKGY